MTTCTLANRHSKADRMWRELVPSFAMNQAIFFKFANGVSRTNQQGPVHKVYHADKSAPHCGQTRINSRIHRRQPSERIAGLHGPL